MVHLHFALGVFLTALPYFTFGTGNTTFTSMSTFQQCPTTNVTYCQNGGKCFQSIQKVTEKFCLCTESYSGELCETESIKNAKTYLYVAIFVAALFLISTVMLLCHLYMKYGELKNLKENQEREKDRSNHFNRSPHGYPRGSPQVSPQGSPRSYPRALRKREADSISQNSELESVAVDGEKSSPKKANSFKNDNKLLAVKQNISNEKQFRHLKPGQDSDTESVNSHYSDKLLIPSSKAAKRRPRTWADGEDKGEISDSDASITTDKEDSGLALEMSELYNRSMSGGVKMRENRHLKTPNHIRKQKARSLQDLRELHMAESDSESSKDKPVKSGYIKNIHTGQLTKVEGNLTLPRTNKRQGIWARSQEEINKLP